MKRGRINFPPQNLFLVCMVAIDRAKTTKTCLVVCQAKMTELSQEMSANIPVARVVKTLTATPGSLKSQFII